MSAAKIDFFWNYPELEAIRERIRTEFADDANMRAERTIPDYRPVIEPIRQYLYGSAGTQPGDPLSSPAYKQPQGASGGFVPGDRLQAAAWKDVA